jgi:hypothetical protein
MFGIYFVENKEEDRVLKKFCQFHEINNLPKFIFYNKESDDFKILDYNFETYKHLIDKCNEFLPTF